MWRSFALPVAIGVLLVVILFEVCVEAFLEEKNKSIANKIARTIFIAGLAYYCHLTLENNHLLESLKEELSENILEFQFFKPYETIQKLDTVPTFQGFLKAQLENVSERLKEIDKREVILSREEVVPVWESLISKYARKNILATNIVCQEDWKNFSPNQGMEAHETFLRKSINSTFSRLFIFDSSDSVSLKGTYILARHQLEMAQKLGFNERFKVKFIDENLIENTSYGARMYTAFETLDIVLFDNECLLQTITKKRRAGGYEIVTGIVSNKREKLAIADEMFNNLWNRAMMFNDFTKSYSKLSK